MTAAGSDDADWSAAAFEALEIAAVVFDRDFGLQRMNGAWRRRFPAAPADSGSPAASVLAALETEAGTGWTEARSASDLIGVVRSCVRDYELPRGDLEPLLMTSTALEGEGWLVTVRDPDRGRIIEGQAFAMMQRSLDTFDLGVLIWDAGLVVRSVNAAWARHVVPVAVGDAVGEVSGRMAALDMVEARPGLGQLETLERLVLEAHRHPRQWQVRQADGRLVRIASVPTRAGGVLCVAGDVSARVDLEERAQFLVSDVIESLGIGVVLLDGHLRTLHYNRAMLELVFDPADPPPVGISVMDLVEIPVRLGRIPVPAGLTRNDFVTMLRDAVVTCRDDVFVEMSGGQFVEGAVYPTAMGGYVVTVRDATERVRAEAALRQSEARTRTIVETLGEGIALYDKDLRLEMNNPAFRRLIHDDRPLTRPGTPLRDEIAAILDAGLMKIEGLDRESALDALVAGVPDHLKDVEAPVTNGRKIEASAYGTPDGGHIVLMRDVTKRHQAERAAREADDLVRTIVEASPTTFLVTRLEDGEVIYAPPLSRDRFGAVGSTSPFVDPADRVAYIAALERTGRLTDYPVRFRRADGSIMDGLTSARIIEHRGEKLIVSSTRDITEQLAMQAELTRQREAAHQNEKLSALGGLLAGVAHELNNPLSIIVANAAMLEEDVTDPALRRRIERLATAARRSGRIVKTFLAMARNRPSQIERVRSSELIETALEVASYGLDAMGARIVLDLDATDPVIAVDPDHIVQVLTNLIINAEHALRAKGEAGQLSIRSRRAGTGVEILVEDNGPGVPVDLRGRIFEPYFSTKELGEGTGVGLAFSHRVITSHGGTLGVEDGPDGGARFRITLPAADMTPATADEPVLDDAVRRLGTVLVIDDEPDVGDTVADALGRAGYEVTVETDAARALDLCRAARFDAILSDVRMPGMDGPTFLAALRAEHPDQAARLAFMTGDAIGGGTGSGIAGSGRPWLEKPVEPGDILRLVAQIIEEAGR